MLVKTTCIIIKIISCIPSSFFFFFFWLLNFYSQYLTCSSLLIFETDTRQFREYSNILSREGSLFWNVFDVENSPRG